MDGGRARTLAAAKGDRMGAVAIRQMVERVSSLMEERLRVRGPDLAGKLRRGGRLLPRRVRAAAQDLAQAGEMAGNPKLLVQLDFEKISADYDICVRHLTALGARDRWAALALRALRTAVIAALLAGGLAFALAQWRGLV